MENNTNISEYDDTHIDQIIDILNKIPVKDQIEQKDQSELNIMTQKQRALNSRQRIEETAKRDLEPGVYKTRVEWLRIAIISYSKDEIRQLLEYSSHLYDTILQYIFKDIEKLWGKDFQWNEDNKKDYYKKFINYVRPNQQSSYTSNISLLDTLIS